MTEIQNQITIFTDGSSRGNPGPGGWGALVVLQNENADLNKVWELGGHAEYTTNNRMELTAVLEACVFIESRTLEGNIEIRSDSAYVLNGITAWVFGWEKNGWKTKTGEEVLNRDLWEALLHAQYRLKTKNTLTWKKVAGHAGVMGNERVDVIATEYADGARPLLFTGGLVQYEKLLGHSVFAVHKELASKKSSTSSSKKAYAYVSCVDTEVHVDTTWALCEKRVKGKKGARFKKVFSKEEADSLAQEWSK